MSGKLGILVLDFIKYSREKYGKLDEHLLKSLQEGKWLKTLRGYESPVGSIFLSSGDEKAIEQIADLPIVDSLYYRSELTYFLHELKFLGVIVDVEEVYKLIPEHFRFTLDFSSLTRDSVILLLKCVRSIGPAAFGLNHNIHSQAWLKTNSGFRCPSECLLFDPGWDQLRNVVSFPIIDESYYGSRIRSYKAELEAIGVIVNLDFASKLVIDKLKLIFSSTGLTSNKVISVLNFLKSAKNEMPSLVSCIVNYLSNERWLRTKHGYRHASKSILFDSDWATMSHLVDLPIIDEAFYGDQIYSFKHELKMIGVVVNLREGIHLFAHDINLQEKPSLVTAETAFSLLQCAEFLLSSDKSSDKSLLEDLLQKLREAKWLKTHMGYRYPSEALLFNMDWEVYLKELDGPFIDLGFYTSFGSVENEVLRVIGVKTVVDDVCNLIVQNLTSHGRTSRVRRVYKFLKRFHWTPKIEDNVAYRLWIPDQLGSAGGKWACNSDCVVHDEYSLFAHHLHALDKYYEIELLPFLSLAFHVAWIPTIIQCIDLWRYWSEVDHQVTAAELNLFWGYILLGLQVCCPQRTLESNITMLPAICVSGKIHFLETEEIFVANDLLLKKSFSESSERLPFGWFPEDGFSSAVRLSEIYGTVGVEEISESVKYMVNGEFHMMDTKDNLIGKPLVKMVLAFLASPQINMPVEDRQSKAISLHNIQILGTDTPLKIRCCLQLPLSSQSFHVLFRKKVFWDKNLQRLLVHRPSWSNAQKDIELVTDFALAISEAVLPDYTDLTDLCNLIKTGFPFEFKEDKIDYLLMTQNLELSAEDRKFLDNEFPPAKFLPFSSDLCISNPEPPCTPNFYVRKRRRTKKRACDNPFSVNLHISNPKPPCTRGELLKEGLATAAHFPPHVSHISKKTCL